MEEESATTPASQDSQQKSSNKYIMIAVAVGLGILGLYWLFGREPSSTPSASPSSISGEVDFNGVKPSDAQTDEGEIVIMAREYNSDGEYEDTGVSVKFEDRASWVWEEAESGVTYDIVAEVRYKGFDIDQSQRALATAPATNVRLTFNTTTEDLPEELRDTEPATASISAVYIINGFIPQGSTFSVFARLAESDDEFEEVSSDVPAVSGTVIEYKEAQKGMSYEVQAELYTSDSTFIGQSSYITVTAPASNERIVINSTASAPSQSARVSGTITVNGPFENGSTILLLQRQHTQSDYEVVERYNAARSIDFSWDGAVAGTTYDFTTALQVGGENTNSGNVVTVAAPAQNVSLQVDTGFNLDAPTETARVSCGSPDSTNHFNARVEMQQFDNAKLYYLEVGTSAGSNNVFAGTVAPRTAQTVFVAANTPYFTRYAYTECADCDRYDHSNWSGWSPTLGFQCPQQNPTPTQN